MEAQDRVIREFVSRHSAAPLQRSPEWHDLRVNPYEDLTAALGFAAAVTDAVTDAYVRDADPVVSAICAAVSHGGDPAEPSPLLHGKLAPSRASDSVACNWGTYFEGVAANFAERIFGTRIRGRNITVLPPADSQLSDVHLFSPENYLSHFRELIS